jgi:anti-sigma-K factor RskA
MREQSHEDVKALIGAYVLGAVPPEEVPSIRAHMLSCDECMAEADELSEAADSLSLTVDPVAPPLGFTQAVLERAAQERSGAPRPSTSRRRWRPLLALSYAAVAVFAVVMGGIALDARQDAEANRRIATALLGAAQGIELRGEAGVAAKVVQGETGAVFVATGLEELPSERTYQLWFMRDGVPVSAGTFDVSDGVAVLRTSRSPEAFDGAAVTVEPSGGSPQPTTEPVIQSA